jgi:spore coat protein JB
MMHQKTALLNKLRAYEFAALELNLYLDAHPFDRKALSDYNYYARLVMELKAEYERIYGPLIHFGFGYSQHPWQWIQDPWPWDRQ